MAERKISHVTLSEIQEELGKSNNTPSNSSNFSIHTNSSQPQSYVSKLKDDEIISFFKPFGYLKMDRQNESTDGMIPMVGVYCKNFLITFSDYDIFVNFNIPELPIETQEKFDFNSFVEYCEAIETTPEKALSDIIQIQLLGQRFHSYQKNYVQRKQKERKTAFENLPKPLQKYMQTVDEKREHEIDGMQNKLMYNSFSGDPKSKN